MEPSIFSETGAETFKSISYKAKVKVKLIVAVVLGIVITTIVSLFF